MKTVFLRVIEAEDKATALLEAIHESRTERGRHRYEVDPRSFASVPRSPFAYWVGERLQRLFTEIPPLASEGRTAKQGLATGDDFRFLRTAWEIDARSVGKRWVAVAKGGAFSPIYSDIPLVLEWSRAGAILKATVLAEYGNVGKRIYNEDYYFRPGLTWSLRTQAFGPRVLPSGCIFTHKGPGIFTNSDDQDNALSVVAILSSSIFGELISLSLNAADATARSFEVGIIQSTPVPILAVFDRAILSQLARRAWSLRRSLDTCTEPSHAFVLPALLQLPSGDAASRAAGWPLHIRAVKTELASIQSEIDERCFALYGIDEADRRAIAEASGFRGSDEAANGAQGEGTAFNTEEFDEAEAEVDAANLAAELVSWSVGVAFGRFDVRLATDGRPTPSEPAPFEPLPACSPGMLAGDEGLPLASPPSGYPITFPEAGVLVDDPGHQLDMPDAVRAVFDAVFGSAGDSWWTDVASLLDAKSPDLRGWLSGSFFEHHLKRYSKSRRKAPILWQLCTSSGRYSVWLYSHRLTGDTLFQVQNEIVAPKLSHEERQLANLIQNSGGGPSATERKEIAAQEAFVAELRAMLEEVKSVAPLWNPNLDDGVVLTMAPLWRLVPQHKSWQRELKSKWEELAAGKYDWAHLAMHLWPERVVPKCAVDRSVAIAHGLEDVFWAESDDERSSARRIPTRLIEELVGERTSPAVKEAVRYLGHTAAAGESTRRSRRGNPDA